MSTPALVKLRSRIATLQADRQAVAALPLTRTEANSAILAECQALARLGNERLALGAVFAARGDPIAPVLLHGLGAGDRLDLGPVLAAICGPELLASRIAAHLSDGGIGAADRAQRLAAIDTELNQLERAEEDAVCVQEAAGKPCPRRPDARPEIVLAVPPEAAS